jgi:ABC-type phosphate/phosphonate transport system substrate-binding protein
LRHYLYVLFTNQKQPDLYTELSQLPHAASKLVYIRHAMEHTAAGHGSWPWSGGGSIEPGQRGRAKVLRFAVPIAQENPETAGGGLEPVRRYLGRRMGRPVEVTGTNGYGAVIEALRAKKLEACSRRRSTRPST